jgi:acylphosphatase
MSALRHLAFRVEGKVQGVSFRAWTHHLATELGLHGEVHNVRDGSVEGLISGPGPEVSTLLNAMLQGPPGAAVRGVWTAELPVGTLIAFEITATTAASALPTGAIPVER